MSALPREWESWRRARQLELIATGMARSLARRWAKAEAQGRCRIARVAGYEAASTAPLDWRDHEDGSTTWRVLLDPGLIPAERRDAVAAFLFGNPDGDHH